MGLFALVSLNINKRTKEIGIRKVLGASVYNIAVLITREFLILVSIGSVLAAVLGYFLVDILLSSIWAYYCDFGVMPYFLAVVIIFVVSMLSVGIRVHTAATSNPVNALKYE
jgi:ABC-type antimicrobial peptide transport system permease subunit